MLSQAESSWLKLAQLNSRWLKFWPKMVQGDQQWLNLAQKWLNFSHLPKSRVVTRASFSILKPCYDTRVAKSEPIRNYMSYFWRFECLSKALEPVATASLVWFPLAEKANGTFVLSVKSSNKLKVPPTLVGFAYTDIHRIYEDFTKTTNTNRPQDIAQLLGKSLTPENNDPGCSSLFQVLLSSEILFLL